MHAANPQTDPAQSAAIQALLPLTPGFDTEQHGVYLRHLEVALKNKKLHNIALTGNYGIGKSSILDEATRNNPSKILNLSISTLGDPTPDASGTDDPDIESPSITNRLQKEIVKQLLYQALPSQLPNSSFRRLGKFRVRAKFFATGALVLAVGMILALTGLLPTIWPDAPTRIPRWLLYAGLFFLITGLLTYIQRVLDPRWSLSEVSAGGASISLSSVEPSFDKHLDEIVYFFEVLPFDIVIFEDIDRFGDPHIFEALRELNTLLNASAQLKKRSIRFVYAIKDSIFEQIGNDLAAEDASTPETDDAAKLETARANRTKFFDLVIPVVPFITHRNSRDLMSRIFTTAVPGRAIDGALIDLVAKHITDMRLIKNIHNEFVVFADRLLSSHNGVPGLEANRLLAMIVYKNIHLSDFERISRGDSDLDTVYLLSRKTVNETVGRLTRREREISDETAGSGETERASRLGPKLVDYIDRITRHTGPQYNPESYSVNGQSFTVDQLGTPEFWRKLNASETGLDVLVRNPHTYGQVQLTFSVEDLRTALNDSLQAQDWINQRQRRLRLERTEIQRKLRLVRHGELAKLMTDEDFTVNIDGQEMSFNTLVEKAVRSKLAVELIRSGHIDRNFTLYVSQYYGVRVSADVMTFIVRSVQTGTADMHFSFSDPADIDALLAETDDSFLTDRSAYNISLVDHLSEQADDERLYSIIPNIIRLDDEDSEFLNTYLNEGTHRGAFVPYLSGVWSGVFSYLVGAAPVSAEDRALLVSAALTGGSDSIDYGDVVDGAPTIGQYVREHAAGLPCLTDPEQSDHAAQVMSVLRHYAVTILDITVLAPELRRRVIAENLYDLTATNLHAAIDQETGSLALDAIRARNDHVYRFCLGDLAGYTSAVDTETTYCIDHPDSFSSVLADIGDQENIDLVEKIISRAAPEDRLTALPDVPPSMWPILARQHRFPSTFSNTEKYIEHFTEIDTALGGLLTHTSAITEAAGHPEDNRQALAITILNSSSTIPEPRTRIALAESLELDFHIDPTLITPEPGPLLTGLLEHDIVKDEIALFTHFHGLDWNTLETAIAKSNNFATFISPELLDENDLPQLFRSALVPEPIKRHIISAINTFAPRQIRESNTAAAEHAIRHSVRLTTIPLRHMAESEIPARVLIQLLAAADDSVTDTDVVSILAVMPTPYPKLASNAPSKFDLPNDDIHQAVLNRLKRFGIALSYRRKAANPTLRSVTVGPRA
ncbi:hypothetical protein G8767_27070 [Rhodococcus sp. IC4_135]|uniref:YobI family P-loop NTPase n=1 Tax=Rhodococcus sp. IC4_135 TaxID=2715537 RepID=UPI0014227B33|nr:hypothetical protein [Rhodococcus sp. IC4_135]